MNVLHILPEMDEGGVERHVLWLANELSAMGHTITVVSAGGKLENHLKDVKIVHLPVHRKNPLTALYSAFRIARIAKREKTAILHAHSRVPAWIAWWASLLSGVPWIATCHAFYSRNAGLIPYKRARLLVCVSESLQLFYSGIFPGRECPVIYNGLPPSPYTWKGSEGGTTKFLFVGRLTRKKGLLVLIEAFSRVAAGTWSLDVLGDGPLSAEAQVLTVSLGLQDRIFFHGFCDTPEKWMAQCSCFLFPSLEEGMGLTLMRAISMGVPTIASDLPAVRELSTSTRALVKPGDVNAWAQAIGAFLKNGATGAGFDGSKIPSKAEMAHSVVLLYDIVSQRTAGSVR